MGVLERPEPYAIIVSSLAVTLITGAILCTALMVSTAGKLSGQVAAKHTAQVSLGPLQLVSFSKAPIQGGYQATMQFQVGLLWYVLLWLCVGAVLAAVRLCFYRAP